MRLRRPTHRRWILAGVMGAGVVNAHAHAHADLRGDLKRAYKTAKLQLDELEISAALETLDRAIAAAASTVADADAGLAPVHAMRAGLIFAQSHDEARTVAALERAIRLDYFVGIPIELRSEELGALIERVRADVGPSQEEPLLHATPVRTDQGDIEFSATYNGELPEGATMALHWRPKAVGEAFRATSMTLFVPGNSGGAAVTPEQHDGRTLEYFFDVFDATHSALAHLGSPSSPLQWPRTDPAGPAASADPGPRPNRARVDNDASAGAARPLPRFFVYFGVGAGLGVAWGVADRTYEQYMPAMRSYGVGDQACALARWRTEGEVAATPSAFQATLEGLGESSDAILPASVANLVAAYDADRCRRHHPVRAGLAWAPLHVAPEFGVRLSRRLQLSLFARIQVISGAVLDNLPSDQDARRSFFERVLVDAPKAVRVRSPIAWAIGLKLRYFLGKGTRKLRPFVGGFVGYGTAQLRVPLGFTNDRNGNSVPDAGEITRYDGLGGSAACVAVWPYNNACVDPGDPNAEAANTERTVAASLRGNTARNDQRIDTVMIGPAMIGGVFGLHYQVAKHFALFVEMDAGAYFGRTSSFLTDLTMGPVITF